MKEGSMDGEKDSYSPRVFNSMSSEDDRTSVEDDIREGKNRTEESPACGNLVLDEPLGDATHALLSFCMQRNPWMYTQPTEEDGSVNEEEGLGPNALYKDVLSCLMDTPLLREELECYSEALNPSPFPSDNRRISCSSKSYSVRRSERGSGRCQENRTGVPSEGDSSSDESTPGDLTDGSQDSDELLSKQARSLSYCNSKMRKKDAVEEMRAFTTFASLRMQEVSDLVCGQEVRRAARRELDKQFGRNNWSRGDGTSRDEADSAAAAAFMKALETCTQTWWSYTNLHK